MIGILSFYVISYMQGHEPSSTDDQTVTLSAQTLLDQCNYFNPFPDDSYGNVCDPDSIMTKVNKGVIQEEIQYLESDYASKHDMGNLNVAVIVKEKVNIIAVHHHR